MSRMTRRRALQVGTASAFGYLFTGSSLSVRRVWGAADKIRVAGIGIGGKGSSDIEQAAKFMDVVALCDIDDQRMAGRAKTWPNAKQFFDYRVLFDKMEKDIDAVTVSTADHSHAPASMRAMKLGKHVYCQKPLTHTVHEARVMRELAAKSKVCTQMGNQGSALSVICLTRIGSVSMPLSMIHALNGESDGPVWRNNVWTSPSISAFDPSTMPPSARPWPSICLVAE